MFRLILPVVLALFSTHAQAQFVIEKAETRENRVELFFNNSLYSGTLPIDGRRFAYEAEVEWGVLSGWTSGLALQLERIRGSSGEFAGVEWTNTLGLIGDEAFFGPAAPGTASDLDLSFFASLRAPSNGPNDVVVTVGPLLGLEVGPVDVTANVLLEAPLDGGDAGLSVAGSAMYEFMSGYSAGLEAHSRIPDIFGNSPGPDDDQYYVGPAVAAVIDIGEGREIHVRLGGFVGLTDGSADFVTSFNASLALY